MSDDLAVGAIVTTIIAVIVAVILAAAFTWQTFLCDARWSNSGMKSSYSMLTGCMIEVTPGKVIPEKNYRGVE